MAVSKRTMWAVAAVLLLALAGVGVWLWMRHRREEKKTEGFTHAGQLDNVGSLLDDQYDLLQAPDMEAPAAHFADLVADDSTIEQPADLTDSARPMERLHRIQGQSLMPRTSRNVTPYNVDVANPTSHSYMASQPRVQLKSRFKDYSLSGMIRGDVPVNHHPNICLISKTTQGRDDLRLDGLFTPHFVSLYNKYTGKAFKNMPMHVAGAGQAGGYGGASGEIVMDHY